MAAVSAAAAKRLVDGLAPWANGRHYLDFVERSIDPSAGYRPEHWARLRAIREAYDPSGLFRANHRIR